MPAVLDAIVEKIKRTPFYYGRYNNTLGFSINEAYLRYARECSAAYAAQHGTQGLEPSPLFDQTAIRLRNVFPAERARALSQQIGELIERKDPQIELPRDYEHLQARVKEPLKTLGMEVLDAIRAESVHRALLNYFQGNYRLEWIAAYRSLPSDKPMGSWLWHSDSFPPFNCRMFLHLTPATADSGATDFMTRADTNAFRRAGYFGQYLAERYNDLESFAKDKSVPYRPFHFDVQPGDVTLFNMNCFHRAVAPRGNAFRDVVQFHFLPSPIAWDEQLNKDGINDLVSKGKGYPKDPRRAS